MAKSMKMLDQFAKLAHLLMEGTIFFYALILIFNRFGFTPLSESALFWLYPAIALLYVPLSVIHEKQQMIWIITAGIVSSLIGILLFGQPISVLLLSLAVMVLSVRRMNDGLRAGAFFQLFTYTVGIFAIIRFFGIPFYFSPEENEAYIRMILLLVLLMIAGIMFEHLPKAGSKQPVQRSYWQQWMSANGVLLGGLSGLTLVAGVLSRGLDQVISFVGFGLQQGLLLLGGLLAKLIPVLQQESRDVIEKMEESAEQRMRDTETQEELLDNTVNPWAELITEIIIYLGVGIGILLILLFVIKKIKYYLEQTKSQTEGKPILTHEMIMDPLHETSKVKEAYFRKLKQFFQPYSGKEEHYVRKEYRKVLKALRKKGIWESKSLTIHQLEQVFRNLQAISPLYEKVRYGDQELTSEELALFKKEIGHILQEVDWK